MPHSEAHIAKLKAAAKARLKSMYPKYSFSLKGYKNTTGRVKIRCDHNEIFDMTLPNIFRGRWQCPCTKSFDRLKATLKPLYPGHKFDVRGYSGASSSIRIKCPEGHVTKYGAVSAKSGRFSCQSCKDNDYIERNLSELRAKIDWATVEYVGYEDATYIYSSACNSCGNVRQSGLREMTRYFNYCKVCRSENISKKYIADKKKRQTEKYEKREQHYLSKLPQAARPSYVSGYSSRETSCKFECLSCKSHFDYSANLATSKEFSGRCDSCEIKFKTKRGDRLRVSKDRKHAIETGKNRYRGFKCQVCHTRMKYANGSQCIKCAKVLSVTEDRLAYYKERNFLKRDELRVKQRIYYEANRKELVKTREEWRKENKELVTLIKKNYKHRRRQYEAKGISTQELKIWLESRSNSYFYCRADCSEEYHLDHYIPLSKGGLHMPENFKIACSSCNLQKSSRTPEDWYKTMVIRNIKPSKRFTKLICESVE